MQAVVPYDAPTARITGVYLGKLIGYLTGGRRPYLNVKMGFVCDIYKICM